MMNSLLARAFFQTGRGSQPFKSDRVCSLKIPCSVCLLLFVFVWAVTGNSALAQETPGATGQQAVVEIVRLQYRSPDMVRAMIAPSLDQRGAIAQIDNNLIISTSRANLAQLQPLIRALDVPVRQLQVSIDFAYGQRPMPPPAPAIAASAVDSAAASLPTSIPQFLQQSVEMTETQVALFNVHSATPAVFGAAMAEQIPVQAAEQVGLSVEIRADRAVLRYARIEAQSSFDTADWSSREITMGQWIELESAVSFVGDTPVIPFDAASRVLALRVDLLP